MKINSKTKQNKKTTKYDANRSSDFNCVRCRFDVCSKSSRNRCSLCVFFFYLNRIYLIRSHFVLEFQPTDNILSLTSYREFSTHHHPKFSAEFFSVFQRFLKCIEYSNFDWSSIQTESMYVSKLDEVRWMWFGKENSVGLHFKMPTISIFDIWANHDRHLCHTHTHMETERKRERESETSSRESNWMSRSNSVNCAKF